MVKKRALSFIAGLVIIALVITGYFYVLRALVKPYYFTLNDLRLRIEQREHERKHLGISVSRDERERILLERFGNLPTENEINLQIQIAKGWMKYCTILFGVLAFGTMLSFLFNKKSPGIKRLIRHVAALPAFGLSLPVLFFNDAALALIKPLSGVCSLIFLITVFFTLYSEKRDQRTD